MEVKIIASAITVSSDEDEFVAVTAVTAGADGHEAKALLKLCSRPLQLLILPADFIYYLTPDEDFS